MLGCVALAFTLISLRTVHPFLAITQSAPGELLVIEGWVADYVNAEALAEFQRHPYDGIFVTGGPIEKGAPLSEYGTLAELGAATVVALAPELRGKVQAVPAPEVRQDRTYTSALALKTWCREHRDTIPARVNVVSYGTHARRTRLLFQKAFGPKTEIGIVAVRDRSYDPRRWWASSAGFRSVIDELIAYSYARLFFWPPAEPR